jgi:hypothetical protein
LRRFEIPEQTIEVKSHDEYRFLPKDIITWVFESLDLDLIIIMAQLDVFKRARLDYSSNIA